MTGDIASLLDWQKWFPPTAIQAIDDAASKYLLDLNREQFPFELRLQSESQRTALVDVPSLPDRLGRRLKHPLDDMEKAAQTLAAAHLALSKLSAVAHVAIFDAAVRNNRVFGTPEIEQLLKVLCGLEQDCRDGSAMVRGLHSPTRDSGKGSNSAFGREIEYRALTMPEAEFVPRLRQFREPKDKFAIRVILALYANDALAEEAKKASARELGEFLTAVWRSRINDAKQNWQRVLNYRQDIAECDSRMRTSAALWSAVLTDPPR